MKNTNCPQFIKNLIILFVISGLNIACAVRLEPAYITGLNFVGKVPQQPIIAVPFDSNLGIQTDKGLRFTLDSVFFEVNKANLLPAGELKIDELATKIQRYGSNSIVHIEGHTDNTGQNKYNQYLSELRANTVREALMARGINQKRLNVKGFGENNPVTTNATRSGRQQNRRVEINVLK